MTAEIDRIDVVGQGGNNGGEVLGAERHPLPVGDLSAGAAELQHKSEHLGVDERIVVAYRRDLSVALGFVRVFAKADLPLGAVHVVAVEVRRRVDISGFLRAGSGVHKGQLGARLGKVLDRDAYVAGQRRQQDLHLVLLDQLAHGADGGVGRGIRRGDDEFDFLIADLLAEYIDRGLMAADSVLAEHRIGAFERRGDADLDLLLS